MDDRARRGADPLFAHFRCQIEAPAPSQLPPNALLERYVREGVYVDCYAADISGTISHAQFVEAFYSTALFGVERLILRWLVSKPSTSDDIRALAVGAASKFAAWTVEDRATDQILLCDFLGSTRSWLMVSAPADGSAGTRLYFGSAVVSKSFGFRALLGFHKVYSRLLLAAARRRLIRTARSGSRGATS